MESKERLINPAAYKAFLKRYIKELYEVSAPVVAGAVERCLQKLEVQPTVDAVEVVHGEWGEIYTCHGERLWGYRCSQCEADNAKKSNYCPNCGAKMDGGTDNE